MIQYVVRFIKRFAVLLPGIFIAYLSVSTVYPAIDRRVPAALALGLTYVLGAYVLIPALIRIARLFFPARHLPLYCVTPDGFASDPVNIGVIATRQELRDAMQTAGWDVADKHTLSNILKLVICTVLRQPYPSAPMSSLYLFGRKQDMGFEIQLDKIAERHHVRFWATTFDEDRPLSVRSIHWDPRHGHKDTDRVLWIGAASRDIGIAFIRHNAQFTHLIHPNTDHERDLIVEQLQIYGAKLEATVTIQKPSRVSNRAWLGYLSYLHTDGRLKICRLKAS